MRGIVAAVSQTANIVPALLEGLHKLEYGGYGSACPVVLSDASVERSRVVSQFSADAVEQGYYSHYMQKGIPRQPKVRTNTLELIGNGSRLHPGFNVCADVLLADLKSMLIRNCGTRYHAGLTMRYWLESMAGIRCTMKLASHTCGDTLYAFAEADSDFPESELIQVLRLLEHYGDLSPKLHMVPQHLLAYHGAEDGSRCG